MEKRFVILLLCDFGEYMGEKFIPIQEAVFNKELFTAQN